MSDLFGVQAWIDRLRQEELPILGQTVIEINRLTERPSVPVSLVANVILQDASMTARILRLANSAFYPKGSPVTTISGALTVLGYDIVRGICVSVSIVDSLLRGRPREQLVSEMARSFYAAALARLMAKQRRDESPEEVFVAALLYKLGELAFWCFGGKMATKLEELLDTPHADRISAEQTVLGCRLADVTVELAKSWKLSELLISALQQPDENSRPYGILLAHRFAGVLQGETDNLELARLLKLMGRYTSLTTEALEELVAYTSEIAAEIAYKYGADITVSKIPGQRREPVQLPLVQPEPVPESPYLQPDPLLQLKILRELVITGDTETDTDTIIQLALEGIYRGVGLDRAVYLVISPDGKVLRPKFALGADSNVVFRTFVIDLDPKRSNIFFDSINTMQSIWVPLLPESERKMLSPEVLQIVHQGPFLITPIRLQGKAAGVFYGDRIPSRRDLDAETSESFELFSFQVNQILQNKGSSR